MQRDLMKALKKKSPQGSTDYSMNMFQTEAGYLPNIGEAD